MLAAFGYVKCCVVPASPFSEIVKSIPASASCQGHWAARGDVGLLPRSEARSWSRDPESECGPQTHCLTWNQALLGDRESVADAVSGPESRV